MHLLQDVFLRCGIGLLISIHGSVFGQNYPNKPIRVLTSPAGGGGDFAARQIAEAITVPLAQSVVVDNRPTLIAIEVAAKAPPDGYALLVLGSSLWIGPLLQASVSYDAVRDFSPITYAVFSPNILAVHPWLPIKSVKDLIALAKAKPGELNYASGSIGTTGHIATELFKIMAGVNIVQIYYKTSSQETADLISGYVQLTFGSAAQTSPLVKSGRLRALAVTSAQASALFPGLPTIAASGLPGFEAVQKFGMFAPAKTPATIINRLNQETVRFLKTTEAKERYASAGVEAVGSSPKELAAEIESDIAVTKKVIKSAGIRIN